MTYFFKSGSFTSATLVGMAENASKVLTKNGKSYSYVRLQTNEYYNQDGVDKAVSRTCAVFLEGEHSIPANAIVSVKGEVGISVVVPKSETNKYAVTQCMVRDAGHEVLGQANPDTFAGINQAVLIGRVGSVRAIKAKTAGASVSIAVSRTAKTENGWDDQTEWFDVTFWGKRSENVLAKLGKGDQVLVKGCLMSRPANVNGQQKSIVSFFATDFNILCKKANASAPASAPAASDSTPPFGDDGDVMF